MTVLLARSRMRMHQRFHGKKNASRGHRGPPPICDARATYVSATVSRPVSTSVENAELDPAPHGFSTAGGLQLGQERRDVVIDGLRRQEQTLGDLGVRRAVAQEAQDF